jgi:hypothetical protein
MLEKQLVNMSIMSAHQMSVPIFAQGNVVMEK